MEISEFKAKIFALLREDEEFRYAVAGLLGFEEILRRLDRHEAELIKLREDFNRKMEEDSKRFTNIEAELAKLREDMIAGFKRHDEEFTKVWNEIAKLREDMIAGFRRHDEEIAKLREDMIAGFKRHDEEIAKLREDMIAGFKRHDEEIAMLREDMQIGFKTLNRRVSSLEGAVDSLQKAMISGFGELSKFAGLTFEEFVRKFLTERLRGSGEISEEAELVKAIVNGEEINIFLEEPLIVGEATSYAETADEIKKLLRKAEVAKAKYSKEPRKILVILSAKSEAAGEIEEIAENKGVELVIGKIVD